LRAKGGFFGFARAGSCARGAGFAGVFRMTSFERRDGAVPTGDDRIGSARAEVFAALLAASVASTVEP